MTLPIRTLRHPIRTRLGAARDFARKLGDLCRERRNTEARYDRMSPEGRQKIAELTAEIHRLDDNIAALIQGTDITLDHVLLFDEAEAA